MTTSWCRNSTQLDTQGNSVPVSLLSLVLWILSQRPWLRHGSWLARICLTFIDILHRKLPSDIPCFVPSRRAWLEAYFLHLLTENHLSTEDWDFHFMNFDELSSFCQPRLKTTLRYSAKSVRLGGYDLIQTGSIRWLHHDAGTQRNWTRRATQCQCHCFLWSLGFFRRGPDSDMALDSHGFVWHLLTFYIGSFPLTFHALSLHGERGSRPTSYIFLLKIIFQLRTGTFISWTLTNFHHFVNLVWKRHCATRQSQLDSAAMT